MINTFHKALGAPEPEDVYHWPTDPDTGKESNEIKARTYESTAHMRKILKHLDKNKFDTKNTEELARNYPEVERGGFEVFFLGTRIFSKIQSRIWPNPKLLAERCFKAYMAFTSGRDISEFET